MGFRSGHCDGHHDSVLIWWSSIHTLIGLCGLEHCPAGEKKHWMLSDGLSYASFAKKVKCDAL